MESSPIFRPLPLLLAAAFVAVAALLLSAVAGLAKKRKPRRRYHPVVGTVFHQLFHFSQLYHYHTELSRRRKSFRILFSPFRSDVYTNDPAVIEHILRSNFENYGKGTFNYEVTKDLFGDGIFAVDGSKWRHQRKLASYEFSTRALRDRSGAIFKRNAANLAAAFSEAAASRQAIDVQDWFTKAAMDSIFEIAFGVELNCLQRSSEENSRFVRALDDANLQINWRYFNHPFWKLLRFFNMGAEAVLKDNMRVVDDYVYKLIHSKIAMMSAQQNESNLQREDILSRFLRESEIDPKNMDHRYLRDIALSVVLAGKESTSATLAWFLYMLCKHPSVQEKVAQEVKAAVAAAGEEATFKEFASNINEESLEKMQYLHAALSETLRLYPPIAMDPKVCFSDDTLPDGFDIRAGEVIYYQPCMMGRMKYIWGEDAEAFRPERWLHENGIFCPESPFKFTAFQAGPRICLGKEFAYRQLKIFAAVLLRFFVFRLRNEKETVKYKMGFTIQVDQGLYVDVFHTDEASGSAAKPVN